jgi:hypothetical protein
VQRKDIHASSIYGSLSELLPAVMKADLVVLDFNVRLTHSQYQVPQLKSYGWIDNLSKLCSTPIVEDHIAHKSLDDIFFLSMVSVCMRDLHVYALGPRFPPSKLKRYGYYH